MAQQKVKINLPKGLSATERDAIAQDIIDFIRDRTKEGKGINNKPWSGAAGKYSKAYKRAQGKSEPVDLTLSSEMLDELKLLANTSGSLTIGYDKGNKELNGKVEGNRLGTYGQPTPIKGKARDFLGINQKDLKRIVEKYQDGSKDAEEELAAKALAGELVAGIDFELEDE